MTKQFTSGLTTIAAALSLFVFAQTARADIMDPFFNESLSAGNTCPSNCISVTTAADPISNITTLEYIFYNSSNVTQGHVAIPTVVAGDVLIDEFGTSTVGDVIRFENIGGSAVAFIFSDDIAGGLTADVGLPPSFQSTTATVTETSAGQAFYGTTQALTSGQPGYCASCTNQPGYGLQSADIPEPASLALLGASLVGFGWVRRRKLRV